MARVDVGFGDVLLKTEEAINSGAEVVVHKGGTGSGKTEDIVIYLLFRVALNADIKNEVITIVSESRPHLDIGAIRILKKHLERTGQLHPGCFNETKALYTSPTGTIIEFFSADRIGKALGARRGYLYGNEINTLKEEVWEELARRSGVIIADFNPTSKFWLESWAENYDNVEIIKTNHLSNPFLPDHERRRIVKHAENDDNFRRVHIDCEYGVTEGLVFKDWEIVDSFPDIPYWTGLDFGYTNDPSALIKLGVDGDDLYLDEMLYRTGMINPELAKFINEQLAKYTEVYADSSEPKSIDEIYGFGVNIHPVKKGPDSIVQGIDVLKRYNLKITKRSVNLIKELRNYSYMKDKEGNYLNKPVDLFNHALDAARYGAVMKLSIQNDDLWVV